MPKPKKLNTPASEYWKRRTPPPQADEKKGESSRDAAKGGHDRPKAKQGRSDAGTKASRGKRPVGPDRKVGANPAEKPASPKGKQTGKEKPSNRPEPSGANQKPAAQPPLGGKAPAEPSSRDRQTVFATLAGRSTLAEIFASQQYQVKVHKCEAARPIKDEAKAARDAHPCRSSKIATVQTLFPDNVMDSGIFTPKQLTEGARLGLPAPPTGFAKNCHPRLRAERNMFEYAIMLSEGHVRDHSGSDRHIPAWQTRPIVSMRDRPMVGKTDAWCTGNADCACGADIDCALLVHSAYYYSLSDLAVMAMRTKNNKVISIRHVFKSSQLVATENGQLVDVVPGMAPHIGEFQHVLNSTGDMVTTTVASHISKDGVLHCNSYTHRCANEQFEPSHDLIIGGQIGRLVTKLHSVGDWMVALEHKWLPISVVAPERSDSKDELPDEVKQQAAPEQAAKPAAAGPPSAPTVTSKAGVAANGNPKATSPVAAESTHKPTTVSGVEPTKQRAPGGLLAQREVATNVVSDRTSSYVELNGEAPLFSAGQVGTYTIGGYKAAVRDLLAQTRIANVGPELYEAIVPRIRAVWNKLSNYNYEVAKLEREHSYKAEQARFVASGGYLVQWWHMVILSLVIWVVVTRAFNYWNVRVERSLDTSKFRPYEHHWDATLYYLPHATHKWGIEWLGGRSWFGVKGVSITRFIARGLDSGVMQPWLRTFTSEHQVSVLCPTWENPLLTCAVNYSWAIWQLIWEMFVWGLITAEFLVSGEWPFGLMTIFSVFAWRERLGPLLALSLASTVVLALVLWLRRNQPRFELAKRVCPHILLLVWGWGYCYSYGITTRFHIHEWLSPWFVCILLYAFAWAVPLYHSRVRYRGSWGFLLATFLLCSYVTQAKAEPEYPAQSNFVDTPALEHYGVTSTADKQPIADHAEYTVRDMPALPDKVVNTLIGCQVAHPPMVTAQNQTNAVLGLTNRALRATLLPIPSSLERFFQFVRDNKDELFGGAIQHVKAKSFEEWNSKYSASKQARNVQARERLLSNTMEDRRIISVKAFLKQEHISGKITDSGVNTATKPRVISAGTDEYQVLCGPWVSALQEYLAEVWFAAFPITLTCGMQGHDIGAWFASWCGARYCTEGDFSAFDAGQCEAIRVFMCEEVNAWFGAPSEVIRLSTMKAKSKYGAFSCGVKYTTRGTMASGDPETYIHNSILNGLLQTYAYCQAHGLTVSEAFNGQFHTIVSGDDNLTFSELPHSGASYIRDLGMDNITVQRDDIWDAEFCSGIFLPAIVNGESSVVLSLKTGRLLERFPWSVNLAQDPDEMLRAKALGVQNIASINPICRAFVERHLELTAGVKAERVVERYSATATDVELKEHPEARFIIGRRYGLSDGDIDEITTWMSSLRLREVAHHPLLKHILSKDL